MLENLEDAFIAHEVYHHSGSLKMQIVCLATADQDAVDAFSLQYLRRLFKPEDLT